MNRFSLSRRIAIALAASAAALCVVAAVVLWSASLAAAGDPRFGLRPADPAARAAFVATLRADRLSAANAELFAAADDSTPILLYRPLREAYASTHGGADWVVGQQGTGDCVSWAYKHAVDVHSAVRWKLGLSPDWKESASEPIYGGARVEARNIVDAGWSQGAFGVDGARWLRDWGTLHRQRYPDAGVDLSTYSTQRAVDWGRWGCGGRDDRGRLDAIAKAYPVRDVAPCLTWSEAVAALRSGYPIVVCSGVGFEGQNRDADGFLKPRGQWPHAMAFIGVRFDREGLLCLNSWGPTWVAGGKWPADQPDGTFWIERRTVERMLAGDGLGGVPDSFAVSGVQGFPWLPIDHAAWLNN